MPIANMPMMMAIGETFFLSSQQHSSVTATAARPGISWSRLLWSVVTLSMERPVAPSELYWDRGAAGCVRDALGAAAGGLGDGVPIDVGALRLRDRGDDRGELDGHPALHQAADDEHAEDRGALGDLAHQAAGEVLGDGGAELVAKLLRVPLKGQADDVPQHEEQDRAHDGAAHGERRAEGAEQGPEGEPEDGVADAGERAHHADLDALDGRVLNGGAVGTVLLEGERDADDRGRHVRVRVVELHVALEGRDLVLLVGVELLDRGDHREAPAAVLHALVVPRALEVLVTEPNREAVALGKRDLLICHVCLSSLPTRSRPGCRRAGRPSRQRRHRTWRPPSGPGR